MVVIVCTSFEGTGLVFIVCSTVFKMWQELRSVCRCPCPTLASHQSFLDTFIPIQQAVKRPGLCNRVRNFFLFHFAAEEIGAGSFWWQNWRNSFLFCLVLREVEVSSSSCTETIAWKLKDITIPRQISGLWLYPSQEVLF